MTEKKTRSREGWTRVRFGDVVRLATERCADPLAAGIERYVGLEHLEPSDLRIRTWGNVADGVTFTNRFHPGQVLFGKRRAYQRKVAVADFDGVCSGDIYVFEPADDRLLPELLPFICQTEGFFEHALKTSAGSLSPRTNWTSLQEYEFDLPPVEEQRCHSRDLSVLQTAAESWQAAANRGESLRDALITHLHSRGTLAESLAQTPIGFFPASWSVVAISSRYDIQLGKKLSPASAINGDPRPYLRNENVDWGRLDLSDVKTMCFTPEERAKVELRRGDIVACEGRHVGKSAMWHGEVTGMCCQNTLHRLRAITDQDVPEYMLSCLRHFHVTGRFLLDTAASTIPHLTLDRFRPMLFPFPPRLEQINIINRIQQFDSGMADIRTGLGNVKKLTQCLAEASF